MFSRSRLAVIALLLFAACGTSSDDEAAADVVEFDGVSREEIQSEAEPMTPEEAERLGIVDTTIQVLAPMDPDSVGQPVLGPGDTLVADSVQ